MLKERSFDVTYRDYTKSPLSRDELVEVLAKLELGPRDVLRGRDAKKHGVSADASDDELLDAMATNNRLLQRPILVTPKGARLGRPVEQLLELL